MNNLFVIVILFALSANLVILAIEAPKKDNSTKNDDNKPTPRDDKKTTNPLCTSCNCDSAKKHFDCTNKNLGKLFSMKDWLSLNESGVSVERMTLSQNGLDNVTVFPKFDVKFLDLSHNIISTIVTGAFINLAQLEQLDLSNNQLDSKALTPEVFVGKFSPAEYLPLKNLKVLKLENNNLHTLNSDMFEHFPNLETLSLKFNTFKILDQNTEMAISSIQSLKNLDLSYMELVKIPEHILHGPRELEELDLSGNILTEIPDALGYAINLKTLLLDDNPIPNIEGQKVFPKLAKLELLSMSSMKELRLISNGSFSNLPKLEELHLSNSHQLSSIHEDAFSRPDPDNPKTKDWPTLKKLYMHNCNISSISANLLSDWNALNVIDIRANPWMCDCQSQWLIDTLLPLIEKKTPQIATNILCGYPQALHGEPLMNLTARHTKLRCLDWYGNRPDRDATILVGLLIGILAGIPLTLAMVLIYKRGCFGFGGKRSPGAYSRAFYKQSSVDDDVNY